MNAAEHPAATPVHPSATARVIDFVHLRMHQVDQVGGKNASLGEMISQLANQGVRVPGGFATTADAYRQFLAHNGLGPTYRQRLGGAGC